MSVHYVYRIVVDRWPTEDGRPFATQGFQYWETVVDAYKASEPIPPWLPDIAPWLTSGLQPNEKTGHPVIDYVEDDVLLCVPHATARRYLSKSALTGRLADLLAWGCEARIERAPIGEWEDA